VGYFQNKGLIKILCGLTENWQTGDYFKARENRDWERFDKLSDNEKLLYRIKEAKEYINGYYTDESDELDL
jgi:hypothetical protein